MSDISLYLDQDNELRFNVAIEGSKPGTPKYRLVLEGKGFNYAFAGQQSAQGEVLFTVPSMKNVLKEGRYHADEQLLDELEANGQVIFRYCDAAGSVTAAANPNGAARNIAGIQNKAGNVFGMMPHPERATAAALGNRDGLQVFAQLGLLPELVS